MDRLKVFRVRRVTIFVLLLVSGTTFANIVANISYETSDLSFSTTTYKDTTYDIVLLTDCESMMDISKPELPVRTVCLVFPRTEKVEGVDIISTTKEVLPDSYWVYPLQ